MLHQSVALYMTTTWTSFLCTSTGLAGSGQSTSHRSAEWGACTSFVHRQQRGGEDPGCCKIQAERGPEGHPGWHVWPEVFRIWAPGLFTGYSGTWRAGWGLNIIGCGTGAPQFVRVCENSFSLFFFFLYPCAKKSISEDRRVHSLQQVI